MEMADLGEVKAVFAALFDTCVQYLNSDVIIQHDSWFRDHQDEILEAGSEGDNENEALFRWMQDDDGDTSIVHFVETLKDLTRDSGRVNSIVRCGKDGQAHWVKYLASLLDGGLVSELSLSDLHTALDSMLDQRVITKQVHKQAKEVNNPHTCCQVMFDGILKTRAKSNWPFVFLEAISKIKPDLVQPKPKSVEPKPKSVEPKPKSVELKPESAELKPESAEPKPESAERHSQADPRQVNTGNKTASVVADSNFGRAAIMQILDQWSDFSDGSLTERLEDTICLTEQESTSYAVQSWINSGNVKPTCFTLFENWRQLQICEFMHEDTKPEETAEYELREYQQELAEKALEGINTIICAPTGCGKTLVAVHIILAHLQEQSNETLSRKVIFFARTVPLVMQQYRVLQKFLAPKFKVDRLTGEDRNSLQLDLVIPDVDVIVMTPRILENHLIKNGQEQLEMFSMLVFDECHHARKDEPYNMLMRYYRKRKQNIKNSRNQGVQINTKLPQIVGLTASIGVDNAKSDDQAKENVLQICSNLDVEYISCVEKHIEELKEKVHLCKEELLTIHAREVDPAVMKIVEKMKTLEKCMIKFADQLNDKILKDQLSKIQNRKTVHYGNWVTKVKNIARSLPRSELGKMNNCKRLLIILADYLSTYNVALELHDLVLLRHVMEYLQRCFNQYQKNQDCTREEKAYFESFSELQETMKDRLDSENPNLTLLKTCLMKYIVAKGEASRGIIFVRTRALVRAVTSWLYSCGDPSIESLMAVPFTGTSASSALGGMTVAQQKEIIRLFRAGSVRLLVATSVAEEGIDIPECNLVIKYNYTGNEITTVQTRGRSRQKDGVSLILAMSKIIEKEKVNQKKAEMMDRAVQQIRKMDPLEIHKKVQDRQQQILKEEEASEISKQQQHNSKRRQHFKMVCHGCGDVVIDSSDIRTIYQTHHIVINWDIMKQTQTIVETDSKIFDDSRLVGPVKCLGRIEGGRHCSNKVGSLMIFSNNPYVVLGITRFGIEVEGQPKLFNCRFWKDFPYVIDEVLPEDIVRYLPEVTASEARHDNSRSQALVGEHQDVVQNHKSSAWPHNKRQGRRDEWTMQDVEKLAKMGDKASLDKIVQRYINNAQLHATLSFAASSMRGRDALPGSANNPRAMCELEESKIEAHFIGWLNLESKISSTGRPTSHETFPSPEYSETSSEADSMSKLHSDSLHNVVTEISTLHSDSLHNVVTEMSKLHSGSLHNVVTEMSTLHSDSLHNVVTEMSKLHSGSLHNVVTEMSTLHSDSLHNVVTETRGDNVNKSRVSSSLVKANTEIEDMTNEEEEEDMDKMISRSVTVQAEQTEANNTPSSVDAGSEVEHLAEVDHTFFPWGASYK